MGDEEEYLPASHRGPFGKLLYEIKRQQFEAEKLSRDCQNEGVRQRREAADEVLRMEMIAKTTLLSVYDENFGRYGQQVANTVQDKLTYMFFLFEKSNGWAEYAAFLASESDFVEEIVDSLKKEEAKKAGREKHAKKQDEDMNKGKGKADYESIDEKTEVEEDTSYFEQAFFTP